MNEEIFIRYLDDYSKVKLLNNLGCHGLAVQVLESYFHLRIDFAKYNVCMVKNGILYLRRRKRVFIYSFKKEDLDIIKSLQSHSMIYSVSKIEGLENESNFYEIVYDLDKVFDPNSYSCRKKRYNRLIYPFAWMKKNKVVVKQPSILEVEVLHQAWVEFKLAQPSTFRIMFPTARYLTCYKEADHNGFIDYNVYGFYLNEKLVSVRVLGVDGDEKAVYDLANFTNTWDTPSQIANYFDVYVLKDLYEKGYQVFNCGALLNKGLKAFKCHYPHRKLKVYSYSKLKKKKSESLKPIF